MTDHGEDMFVLSGISEAVLQWKSARGIKFERAAMVNRRKSNGMR